MKRNNRGVTLLELVIAVTIVMIIAALAVPNYRNHVLRSNRTEAVGGLQRVAAAQERFYLQNNTYTANLNDLGIAAVANDKAHYTLAIAAGADVNGFTATASARDPNGGDGGQRQDKECLTFQIDNTGNVSSTNAAGNASTETCWPN